MYISEITIFFNQILPTYLAVARTIWFIKAGLMISRSTRIVRLSRGQFSRDSDCRRHTPNLPNNVVGGSGDLKNENVIRDAESNILRAESTRADTEVIR